MALFRPNQILNRFNELDIEDLKNHNFKVIFIDVDNTITTPKIGSLTPEAREFIENIKKAGLRPIIFSNSTKKRVKKLVNDYDVDWNYLVMKPLPFSFFKLCMKYNYKPDECVIIGDQLLTDILCANLAGAYGIYSKQLQEKDTLLTSINRKIEKIIWRKVLNEEM